MGPDAPARLASKFDLGADELIEPGTAGASDDVIRAMMQHPTR